MKVGKNSEDTLILGFSECYCEMLTYRTGTFSALCHDFLFQENGSEMTGWATTHAQDTADLRLPDTFYVTGPFDCL